MTLINTEKFDELLNKEDNSNQHQRKGYLKLNYFIHPLSIKTVSNYITSNMYPEAKRIGEDQKMPDIYKEQYIQYINMRTSVLEEEKRLLQNFHRERMNSQSKNRISELKQFHDEEVLKSSEIDQKKIDENFELENEKLEMEFENLNQFPTPTTHKPERKKVIPKEEMEEKVEMSYGLPETIYDELGLYNQKLHENELAESECGLDEEDEKENVYASKSVDGINEELNNDNDINNPCTDFTSKTLEENKDRKKKKKKLLGKVKKMFGKGRKSKK